jgi:hypothetical protein
MSARYLIGAGVLVLALVVPGCGDSPSEAESKANQSGESFQKEAYIPPVGNTEQRNYNEAQKLYNDPATILWCSAFPQSSTAPIITVPISGKLTSSTTTAFRPEEAINNDDSGSGAVVTRRSVDGLYHPNPPAYRFGFTPGGQLVDFFNMPTICTTQPLEFQRQSVTVQVATDLDAASKRAEKALSAGDEKQAQAILEGAAE